jgi:hypothetical protein
MEGQMNPLVLMAFLVIAIAVVTIIYAIYFFEKGQCHRNQRPFALAIGANIALLVMEGGDAVRGMVPSDHSEFLHIFVMQLVVLSLQAAILFFVREHGFRLRCTDCPVKGEE